MLDSDTKNMISVWIGTSDKTLDEFNNGRFRFSMSSICRFWGFIY